MLKNLFTEHPASVGESYFQHMGVALSFTSALAFATFACLMHAFFPFLFVKTGSLKITELHDRMVANRHHQTPENEKITTSISSSEAA
ncbi:DUF6356 family protein [Curvivirga aplysinae]|uniref:DUF6356 family protein n=1 Tax=Curvivirga aplysinae TaxID=2529852 RepID=UPI0012BB7139|nr:DUF6356 family protein [Curvivirga aplysinae]MTI08576.1 hypothetical protein [Curvivirga aplysinae]